MKWQEDITSNEELRNLHSLPHAIRVIRSRKMRWSGYVARIGEKEECIKDIGRK
jgi:hypothetical protein